MAEVSTTTPAAPTAQRAGAGLWRRTRAFALDYLLIAGYLGVLAGGAWALRHSRLKRAIATLYGNPMSAQASNALLLDLPVLLFFSLFEASGWQATPGKRKLGLRAETTGGKRLSVGRAVARTALKLLPWEVAHTSLYRTPGWPLNAQPTPWNYAMYSLVYVLAGVYIVTLLAGDSRQTLYDRLTRSQVVIAPPDAATGRIR